jgi:hypothetical protein
MKQEFSGEITNMASNVMTDATEGKQEWLLTVTDEVGDAKFPDFNIDLTLGVRWGIHQGVGWWFDFDPEKVDVAYLERVQDSYKEFLDFAIAVERAGVAYKTAIAKLQQVIGAKLEADNVGKE